VVLRSDARNTETTKDGIKTRRFDNILKELELAYHILKDCGLRLAECI